ncbi:MAG: ribokinase [Chloroflexi bacterium]|nr:ribokinase [Chloroflexota bacterium]
MGAANSGTTASVVVVGSINTDLVTYVRRAPGPGETVIGDRFQSGFGGKGANQAVMARQLGADVSFIGALGDDFYAALTLENFERLGINADGVMRVPGSSGVAPIWVEADGTNRIIVVPGANDLVTAEHATRAIAAIPHIDVCVGQFEIPQAVTAATFSAARARGAVTILNPAPAARINLDLLAVTDWLIPNEVEFGILADRAIGAAFAVSNEAMAEFSRRIGVRLIVTLGSAGAACVGPDAVVTRLPARAVTAVDTTGAGDAFVGAFAVGLARGWSEIDSVRLGIACATESVLRPGTQSSFPSAREAAAILADIEGPGARA